MAVTETVWVFGDQLNADLAHLRDREPGSVRVLLIESDTKLRSRRWHRQRAHLYLTAMRRFATELTDAGHEVDHREATSFAAGLAAHRAEFDPERVTAMEPNSWAATELCHRLGVELVRSDQFLCHRDDFERWAADRRSLKMEDFYRWQRQRLDVLMDGGDPVGGRWNLDHDNREPPPKDGRAWPEITRYDHDAVDRAVLARLAELDDLVGAEPSGWWPTSRAQALERLDEFVTDGIGPFGPYEDAMLAAEWKLAHSTLSTSLNLGFLHPSEVVDAVVASGERGAPLNSVEGFVRQVIGWREYVWGLYWLWMPEYALVNELGADRPLPASWRDGTPTGMACLDDVLGKVEAYGWAHHIERLMVLGNLALTHGVRPVEVSDWMWERFVDGAEWVMLPNVQGMALFADGGRMATKPYASGGAYLKRMSDHCGGCRFDPGKRTGPTACPYTSLYWDFLARNEATLSSNHRIGRQYGTMRKLKDLAETRERAAEVRDRLDRGFPV